MSGPAELAIAAGVLLDAGLKATLVLGLGLGTTLLLRAGSAAQRHAVWAATLAVLPILPLFAWSRGADIAVDVSWVPVLWLAGAVVTALPTLAGLWSVRRLTRASTAHGRLDGVFVTDAIQGPATWGLWRPVILLPSSAVRWPAEHLEAALAHERAHIARGDWAVHLGARAVCSLFWFHPLVWLARRELALEAEHAADDAVVRSGVRPSTYATLLLSVACGEPPPAALGAGSSLMGRRVQAVLDQRGRSACRWPAFVFAVVLGATLLPGLGSWPAWSAPPETLTCT